MSVVAAIDWDAVRTAIATEHLVTATWALAVVAFLTLVAAVVAARYAKESADASAATYRLEAQAGVVITAQIGKEDRFPQTTAHILVREDVPVGTTPTKIPRAELRPFRPADESRGVPQLGITLEVRNVGRAPIVEALLVFTLDVPEYDRFPDDTKESGTHTTRYESGVRIPAIAPNSGVVLPIVNAMNSGLTLNLKGVTQGTLGVSPGPRERVEIPWICEPIVFGP